MLGGFTGGVIGGAVVRLLLDDNQYKTALAKAQAQGSSSTSKMGSAFTKFKVIGALAFAAVGAAAFKFAGQAIEAASAQEEALNKAKVVFGESAGAVEAFAETAALGFGISKTAALQAAGGFGQMLQTAGLVQKASADMSISLVALAGDLASFNDVSTDEALLKLKSGLAGEAEPLRQMGVFLSEARVKSEAYAAGLAKVDSELTEGQKVQARYNLILKDTNLAQGDFANTSTSLANQQRSLSAQWENFLATAGPGLSALLAKVLFYVNDLITKLPDIGGLAQNVFIDFANVLIYVANIFKSVVLVPILHGINLIIQAVDTLLGPLINFDPVAMPDSIDALEEVEHGMEETGGAAKRNFKLIKGGADSAGKAVSRFVEMTGDELKDWKQSVDDSFDAAVFDLSNTAKHADITRRSFIRASNAMESRAKELARAMRQISTEKWVNPDYIAFLSEQGPEFLIGFTKLNRDQQRDAQGDWEDTTRKVDDAKGSLDKVVGAVRKLDGMNAHATVTVTYVRAGVDPQALPGLSDPKGNTG